MLDLLDLEKVKAAIAATHSSQERTDLIHDCIDKIERLIQDCHHKMDEDEADIEKLESTIESYDEVLDYLEKQSS